MARPEPAWATVTIPYAELKGLWEMTASVRQRELESAESPVAAALVSAEYDLIVCGDQASLEVAYRARSFVDNWQMIPLLGGDARLLEADAHGPAIVWVDDRYCLLTQGTGEFEAKLRCALPPPAEWSTGPGLRLRPGRASLNCLRIAGVPEGKVVRVAEHEPTRRSQGTAVYPLPADSGDLVMSLADDQPPAPLEPSRWELQSETLVAYDDGRLTYENRVTCRAEQGTGLFLELALPPNASGVETRGDDLAQTTVQRREDGRRILRVQWQTRDVLERQFWLCYGVPQSPLSTQWRLQAPRSVEDSRSQTRFVILSLGGLELAGPDLKPALESRPLPEWLREKIGPRDFLTADVGAECVLSANWLPRVPTAQAMIRLAEYRSRVVPDGGLLVASQVTLEHRAPLNWRVQLPPVDELLSCEINQKPVQPVRRGPSEIEFPLTSPEDTTTRISFTYTAHLAPFDPVSGGIALELPRTDLFIHQLSWLVELPETYETTAVEGNLQIGHAPGEAAPEPPASGHVVWLTKELVRGEAPVAQVYYQRRVLSE